MGVSTRLNEWLSVILKLVLIIAISAVVVWGGMSVYANITEKNTGSAIPKLPDVKKAENMVVLKATGELLLTDSYEIVSDGNYILHGYFAVTDGKWKWHDADLPLDEKYFGEITIKRRGS